MENHKIRLHEHGNVVGIFFFERFENVTSPGVKEDVCDLFNGIYDRLDSHYVSLNDVGDWDKLLSFQKTSLSPFKTRFFNRISQVGPDLLKKECIHVQGHSIMNTELKYYKAIRMLAEADDLPFPRVHEVDATSFTMDKVHGSPLRDHNLCNQQIIDIIRTVSQLHKYEMDVTADIFYRDLAIEFSSKIKRRHALISPLLSHFNKMVTSINLVPILYDAHFIIDKVYARILEKTQSMTTFTYNVIHGDCQMSNTLLDEKSGKICLIDPRGYYGETFMYGWKYYDYSKILYSLSGFDEFNSCDNFSFTIDPSGNISLDIHSVMDKYKDVFLSLSIDWEVSTLMVIVHWFGLSQYFSNNIHKAVAAYYYAMYLYHTLVVT
jgi:tRNA A-37 threonylcarbamoyl transferase component Bud32